MPIDDRELHLVCAAMLLVIAVSASLAIGPALLSVPLTAALLIVGAQLLGCARRPDPWRTFELELAELGVVVAETPDVEVLVGPTPRSPLPRPVADGADDRAANAGRDAPDGQVRP